MLLDYTLSVVFTLRLEVTYQVSTFELLTINNKLCKQTINMTNKQSH